MTDRFLRTRWRALLPASAVAVLLVTGLAGCAGGSPAGPAAAKPAASDGLGSYPSYLPTKTLHYSSDTEVTGTAAKPAVVSQGDQVKVVTPGWSAVAVVTGPEVPGEGLPHQADFTTCTWIVTLSGATHDVPVSAADFTSIDVRGNTYRPAFVPGQPAVPKVLHPGQKLTFELRTGEAVGEGLFRWAPVAGHIVAKWDFVVEND